jgi:hypothetical protein
MGLSKAAQSIFAMVSQDEVLMRSPTMVNPEVFQDQLKALAQPC